MNFFNLKTMKTYRKPKDHFEKKNKTTLECFFHFDFFYLVFFSHFFFKSNVTFFVIVIVVLISRLHWLSYERCSVSRGHFEH